MVEGSFLAHPPYSERGARCVMQYFRSTHTHNNLLTINPPPSHRVLSCENAHIRYETL